MRLHLYKTIYKQIFYKLKRFVICLISVIDLIYHEEFNPNMFRWIKLNQGLEDN